jgi:hypothetical protein
MAKEQGLSLTGPEGLLQQFTKTVLETAVNEEMTEHLGYEPNQAPEDRDSGNVRNGTRSKTVLTETTGPVPIEVPRDRDGSSATNPRPTRTVSMPALRHSGRPSLNCDHCRRQLKAASCPLTEPGPTVGACVSVRLGSRHG